MECTRGKISYECMYEVIEACIDTVGHQRDSKYRIALMSIDTSFKYVRLDTLKDPPFLVFL